MTHILKRGNPDGPGPAALAGIAGRLVVEAAGDGPRPTVRSTGRRLWLARWLTRPGKPAGGARDRQPGLAVPLRPGLVASSTNDLGVMGDEPTHPELLDWLASELDAPAAGGSSRCTG